MRAFLIMINGSYVTELETADSLTERFATAPCLPDLKRFMDVSQCGEYVVFQVGTDEHLIFRTIDLPNQHGYFWKR